MADETHIQEKLKGLYPHSDLKKAYWNEMFDAFDRLSNDDFDACLIKHRAGPNWAWPPCGPEMVKTKLVNYRTARPTKCKDCGGPMVRCGYCQQCIDRFDAARDRCIARVRKYGFKHVGRSSGELPVNG
jgi:hypothetical protein